MFDWLPHAAVALSFAFAPSDGVEADLRRWFDDYRGRRDRAALIQPEDLHNLKQRSAQDPLWRAEFERLEDELKASRKRSEREAVLVGPQAMIDRIRALSALPSYNYAERVLAYANMLELFDRASGDASPASLSLLLDIASHDRDRKCSPKEWRKLFEFRPRLVQREARLALLRAPTARVLPVALEALARPIPRGKKGVVALSRRVVALEVMAWLAAAEDLPDADAMRLAEAALAAVRSDEEADPSRAAASRVLRVLLSERGGFSLPDESVDRLLRDLEQGIDDFGPARVEAVLNVLAAQVREESIRRLAELLASRPKLARRKQRAVWEALNELAPVSLAYDARPRAWLDWYEKEREEQRFRDWFEVIDRARAKKDKRSAYEPPRFYGVPVVGHRLVFVIDVSGSMNFPLGKAGDTTPKIALAKEQLATAIARLQDYDEFNIVTFDVVIRQMNESMVPVEKARKKAFVFVDKLNPSGGTNLFGGLLAAFGIERPGAVPDGRDVPDQIIVLSDGMPTAGDLTDPYSIREEIARINASRRTRIDTIALGDDADEEFLAGLARDHGGEVVVIKRSDAEDEGGR